MKKIKYKGKKPKIHKAESIKEAINDIQTFFESDLYSKFRPAQILPLGKDGKDLILYREDFFKNEREFMKYLDGHFNILRKEISRLSKHSRKTVKTQVKGKTQ